MTCSPKTGLLGIAIGLLVAAGPVVAEDDGLIAVKSAHDVKTTADRLEAALKEKDMTVFARIDHGANANRNDVDLRPTELVIFGNPNVGGPFMVCGQTAGIDLPQKALIWRGPAEEVWLTYNDPEYLARRHNIDRCQKQIDLFKKALANFAEAATMP